MVTEAMPLEDVNIALDFIGPGFRRVWAKRVKLLRLYTHDARGLELSTRTIEELGIYSRGWAGHTLRAVAEAQVLIKVWDGGGSRGAAYRFNPNLFEWNVPWRGVSVEHVVGHIDRVSRVTIAASDARPVARSAGAYRAAVRSGVAVLVPSARQAEEWWRAQGGQSATPGIAGGALKGGSARRGFGSVNNSPSDGFSDEDHAGGGSGSPAAAGLSIEQRRRAASIEQWVKKRLGVPFFAGANRTLLLELGEAVGDEALYDAILEHEPDRTKPAQLRILDLVEDVTASVLAPHDDRAQALIDAPAAAPATPAGDEGRAGPRLRTFDELPQDDGEHLSRDELLARFASRRQPPGPIGHVASDGLEEVLQA